MRVARRVTTETTLHQRRVSIPSVAVGDFASQIFERFDDKKILVIGAGEMGEETLRYLQDEGAHDVTVVNRSFERAEQLAERWQGRAEPWEQLPRLLAWADLVISTTGASEPIVTLADYKQIEAARYQRPLFILDLAMPRDFEPAIGDRLGVYLYSIDDLQAACQQNRRDRDQELPAAIHIVEQETARFMADLHHRATAPIIKRLREGWQQPKEDELRRLFNKLPESRRQGARRNRPGVRSAGQQAVASAAGIAAQRSRERPAARPARCLEAAVPVEGLMALASGLRFGAHSAKESPSEKCRADENGCVNCTSRHRGAMHRCR